LKFENISLHCAECLIEISRSHS